MNDYKCYLEAYHKEQKAIRKHLIDASKIFLEMDAVLSSPYEMSYEWVENCFAKNDTGCAKRSLNAFLLKKRLIKQPNEEIKYLKLFKKSVDECPHGFKKAIAIFLEEKLELRKRQIDQNARNPLSLRTVETNVGILKRMVKWLQEHYPDTNSWFDVTEGKVNKFLLSLTPNNRECMRKDIYQFFKFSKRKRCIFEIPMTDFKTREVPRVSYVLNFNEQRQLARKICSQGIYMPYEAMITCLAFYHALQSRYIATILLDDVDIENQRIKMNNVTDIYLTPIELLILKEYLILRKEMPNNVGKKYLFIQRKRSAVYDEVPINKTFIKNLVIKYSNYTPQILRITCLTTMAHYNGPQFLREAYGISQTHAARFGKYEDHLLEEILMELIE